MGNGSGGDVAEAPGVRGAVGAEGAVPDGTGAADDVPCRLDGVLRSSRDGSYCRDCRDCRGGFLRDCRDGSYCQSYRDGFRLDTCRRDGSPHDCRLYCQDCRGGCRQDCQGWTAGFLRGWAGRLVGSVLTACRESVRGLRDVRPHCRRVSRRCCDLERSDAIRGFHGLQLLEPSMRCIMLPL